MASEPFFYQSVLLDARRWYTEFYCMPTDRTVFGIRTWPRLVLHVGLRRLRLVFFGGDGVWAKLSAIRTLTWPCPVLHHLFSVGGVLSSSSTEEDAFLCDPAQEKKKRKRIDFCGPFPARGGFVRTPRTPYSYAPAHTHTHTHTHTHFVCLYSSCARAGMTQCALFVAVILKCSTFLAVISEYSTVSVIFPLTSLLSSLYWPWDPLSPLESTPVSI